eukprot:CAMPEP_0204151100 /NCGR_PEP_ID=MMETSP0361-20130328/25869_1 /ASSEMBLY_ACC=CAM_ASM_000343 /TAXON_ID=268821 /ORGANISM="Scrippsiella Hangoei, Strain SHTV-5" /LENGTH=165 /DNA_ID=CAMNT_0051105877 /DNA_START=92 /DNA_END=591 /DNA_ORIENTATION=+
MTTIDVIHMPDMVSGDNNRSSAASLLTSRGRPGAPVCAPAAQEPREEVAVGSAEAGGGVCEPKAPASAHVPMMQPVLPQEYHDVSRCFRGIEPSQTFHDQAARHSDYSPTANHQDRRNHDHILPDPTCAQGDVGSVIRPVHPSSADGVDKNSNKPRPGHPIKENV